MTASVSPVPLNVYRNMLLKFEQKMISKYGTRRFTIKYLESEQIRHNILRRALRDALWAANGFNPASVVVDPELNTVEEEVTPVLQKRRTAPIPTVTFVAPPVDHNSEEYVTGVTAADLLRSALSS